MKITIVICTRNRAALLGRTLDSLCGLLRPSSAEWSVLVVANDCSDPTADVADSFRTKLPIECVTEPAPGLSHARNRGVDTAKGDYVIWIDDDVRVEPGWLQAYEGAFGRHPAAAFFGGRIDPEFEGAPPSWILDAWDHIYSAFAARKVVEQETPIEAGQLELPFGANCAVRLDDQRRHRFDPNLGRRPQMPHGGGEEIELFRALLAEDEHGMWVPSAVVHHWVGRERQSIAYLRSYYAGQGLGSGTTPWETVDTRLRDLATLSLKRELQYWAGRMAGDPKRWAPLLVSSAWTYGAMMARLRKKPAAA